MSVSWTVEGVREMEATLRDLPGELAIETQVKALRWAKQAAVEIGRGYSGGTGGRLGRGLQVLTGGGQVRAGRTHAGASVVQTLQPLANYYEFGTKKIRRTKKGAKRGRMPKAGLFASVMPRIRYGFLHEVWAMVGARGVTVTTRGG